MQSENVYIGDDKFQRFLDHYSCPTKLWTVKLKFAGAICSPNVNLRPTDVISSLFPEERQPRLETKAEAELFFKFFMGLWDEMFIEVRSNTLVLPEYKGDIGNKEELEQFLHRRADMLELGFVEGFWGGCSTLNIPQFAAELISSLSDMAEAYEILAEKTKKSEKPEDIYTVAKNTDKTVLKTLKFLIEHLVLPHITNLERTVN
jgi:hypothetical protein